MFPGLCIKPNKNAARIGFGRSSEVLSLGHCCFSGRPAQRADWLPHRGADPPPFEGQILREMALSPHQPNISYSGIFVSN